MQIPYSEYLSIDCLWCEIVNGDLVLREILDDVEWLPADITLINKICMQI